MHKYIETISCINLKVIGHGPGLAFLSVTSLGLSRTLVRVFYSFSQIYLSFMLLTLGLKHQLIRSVSKSSRIYMKCTCMSYFSGNDLFISSLQSCNPTTQVQLLSISYTKHWAIIYRVLSNMIQFLKEIRVELQNFYSFMQLKYFYSHQLNKHKSKFKVADILWS